MSEGKASNLVEQGVNNFFATFERAQRATSIDNVYGQTVTYGETVALPIASVTHVFGLGGGLASDDNPEMARDEATGGGGGGAVSARPIALAEFDVDGVKIHPIVDENRALAVSLAFAAWAVFWTGRTLVKIFSPSR
jgi:uncharacterized spore protein YtfJ